MDAPHPAHLTLSRDNVAIQVTDECLDADIVHISFIVKPVEPTLCNGACRAHATHFLRLPEMRTVQIDMNHRSQDLRGALQITSCDYYSELESTNTLFDAHVYGEFTVRQAIDIVLRSGWQHFTFGEAGLGCQHWQVVMMAEYEAASWVRRNTTLNFHRFVSRQAGRIEQGTFDDAAAQAHARAAWKRLRDAARAHASVHTQRLELLLQCEALTVSMEEGDQLFAERRLKGLI